jgi:hypothetical protein
MESLLDSLVSIDDYPFAVFCKLYLKVQDKSGAIVPLVLNRVQLDIAKRLEQAGSLRVLILKARQMGVSTVVQAWLYYQMLLGGAKTSTICHDDDLTSELRKMNHRFQEELPDNIRPLVKYDNAKETTYLDLNSQRRIATVGGHSSRLSAGKKKGRGGSNTHIHGTEIAFWPDAQGVVAAAMQAGNPEIVLESTPNGMVGWFYEQCMDALDNRGVWSLLFYEWWWDEEYAMTYADYREALPQAPITPDEFNSEEQALIEAHRLSPEQIYWRRFKRLELPHTFAQEYPEDPRCGFLASGSSYFGDLSECFTLTSVAIYDPSRRYVGGLDFAQTSDSTVLIILDAHNNQMVDMLRINNLSWQVMRTRIAAIAHKWDATIQGEANSMGKTNIELLQTGENDVNGNVLYESVKLIPFYTTASSKRPLIQGLYHALHEAGLLLIDDSVLRHELRAFISKQNYNGYWQYMASNGAHDDCVMALALAWYGGNNGQFEISVSRYA